MTRPTVDVKACRLIATDRVTIVARTPDGGVVATIEGDSGRYRAILDPAGGWCSCPAVGRCSHLVALITLTQGAAP